MIRHIQATAPTYTIVNGIHGAYIWDSVDRIVYISLVEAAILCYKTVEDLAQYSLGLPQELEKMTGKKQIEFYEVQDMEHPDIKILCFHHDDFLKVLHYETVFNWVYTSKKKKKEEEEKRTDCYSLLLEMYRYGARKTLLFMAEIDKDPNRPKIQAAYFDVSDRIAQRLSSTPESKTYRIKLQSDYVASPNKWLMQEDPTLKEFFDKWENFTYSLLTGVDDKSLLSRVPYANGGFVIGTNYYIGTKLIDAIKTVQFHVGYKYHPQVFNNLEKLHIEGCILAMMSYQVMDDLFFEVLMQHSPEVAHSLIYGVCNDSYWYYFKDYPSMPNTVLDKGE